MRQDTFRRARNRAAKSALRNQLRKVRAAITAKNSEEADKEYRLLVKKLDRAATKNVIHANAAARTKSRLTAAIKGLKAK
jgi:small subunit ribosomal protein S20